MSLSPGNCGSTKSFANETENSGSGGVSRKISQNLQGAKWVFRVFQSLWNLGGIGFVMAGRKGFKSQNDPHANWYSIPSAGYNEVIAAVKPVRNGHLYNKIYCLWFIQ